MSPEVETLVTILLVLLRCAETFAVPLSIDTLGTDLCWCRTLLETLSSQTGHSRLVECLQWTRSVIERLLAKHSDLSYRLEMGKNWRQAALRLLNSCRLSGSVAQASKTSSSHESVESDLSDTYKAGII